MVLSNYNMSQKYIYRIIHYCSCFIECIKRVERKQLNARLVEHYIAFFVTSLINSITQDDEC